MRFKGQELEVKYYIKSLSRLEELLISLGARLIQERTHENNLRFDTPDGNLTSNFKVLRLRQDTSAKITYKGPGKVIHGVQAREEIEFEVSNLQAARNLLEALGYRISLIYEKYRTIYTVGDVLVTLDEMPFGNFSEIEGASPEAIVEVNRLLKLDWSCRIIESYTSLFNQVCAALKLPYRDLTFENFKHIDVSLVHLGVRPAD